ncbi:MAG: hypothetical protein ACK4K7_03205 [Allosphingosinicella sp.]|uniref:hypothetical protein n=1 Tax=Allosphingosinicella sp. TaxID=2823234 RepID=UPI00395EAD13
MAARAPRLDPAIAEIVAALARADAEEDYRAAAALQNKDADRAHRHLRPLQLGAPGT